MKYSEYKEKLKEWSKPCETTESDLRCKKFLVNAVDSDSILKKILMLNLVTEGAIPPELASLYVLKKVVQG